MTNAPARDVFCSFGTLRSALMAAASGGLLLASAPGASAASCATTTGDDVCILHLGDEASDQNGQAGSDTLQFTDAGTYNTTASQYGGSVAAGHFINFELAHVLSVATLNITSAAADTPGALQWTVDGTLNVSGGNAIADGSSMLVNGGGIFNVNGDETIGSLAGAGSIVVAAGKTLTTGVLATNTTLSGILSGGGNFAKSGTGTMILTGGNTYTGTTTVFGGVLEVGTGGSIATSSAVSISAGATLRGIVAYGTKGVTNGGTLEGNVTVTGDVANNGILRPGLTLAPVSGVVPPSFGTILINGNFNTTGATSFLDMQVDLDAALPANGTPGTTHDFVNIVGNVTGPNPTKVFFTEADTAADTGLATTGNGIQVVRITGTNAAGAFVQGNALNAGAYQYLLTYVPNYSGSDDGYFLKSAIRDELFAQPALLSAGQELIRSCFRDDQRVPDSPKGATYGRAWVGYRQGNTSFGANTGIDMSEDFNCTNGGMDWRMGYGWFGGVSGGFGKVNADLATPGGGGTLDGSARMIEAYASFTSSSLFINLSAGYADMDWTYQGALTGALTTSSSGLIGSAQAGVALDVAPFAVKIFGSVDYDDTNCGGSCFGFAVNEDTGLLLAKGTVRFDGVSWGGSIRPWASVSYSDVLSNGINTVSVGAVGVSADTNSARLDIDAGLQAYLDENFALFADGGYREGLNTDITGYKAGVGLKLYW